MREIAISDLSRRRRQIHSAAHPAEMRTDMRQKRSAKALPAVHQKANHCSAGVSAKVSPSLKMV